MGTQVTITLPDAVYRRAQATARLTSRPVPEVLADVLVEAFPATYVSPDREAMEREQTAFDRLHESLLADYEGQYVAIHGGKLVDADRDPISLARRILAGYPDQVVHIRQVRRDPEQELRMRSPRIVD